MRRISAGFAEQNVGADVLVLGDLVLLGAAQGRHHVHGGAEIVDGLVLSARWLSTRVDWSATSSGWVGFPPLRVIGRRRARQEESPSGIRQSRSMAAGTRLKSIVSL